MSWEALKSAVTAVITANGSEEITGQILQDLINNNLIPQLGDSKFKGVIFKNTPAPTVENSVFYLAKEQGIYQNFGAIEVKNEIAFILKTETGWEKVSIYDKASSLADLTGLIKVSQDYSFSKTNPYNLLPADTVAWSENDGEFTKGKNFATITKTGTGQSLKIRIPEKYRVEGLNLSVVLSYKSDTATQTIVYFRNEYDNAWVNNAGGVEKQMVEAQGENYHSISRKYENGVGYFVFYFSTNHAVNLKIGSIQLFSEAPDNQSENIIKTEFNSAELLNSDITNYGNVLLNSENRGSSANYTVAVNDHPFVASINKHLISSTGVEMGAYHLSNSKKWGKLKASLKYISDQPFYAIVLFRKDGGWLSNANQTIVHCAASTVPIQVELQREYEEGVDEIRIWFCGNTSYGSLLSGNYEFLNLETRATKIDETVTTNYLTVANSGGDFTSLRDCLKSITDASDLNRYVITIKNGTYNEIDVQGTNYKGSDNSVVTVVGESMKGVIVRTDGSSTDAAPLDYSYQPSTYGGQPINTIPQAWRHGFWIHESILFKNLTVYSNDVKYCVHQDKNSGGFDSKFENCHFIHEELTSNTYGNVIGIGCWGAQHQKYDKCIMELRMSNPNNEGFGVFWHNWNSQNLPALGTFTNCKMVNCGIAFIADLVSYQNDVVDLTGSSTNLKNLGVKYDLFETFVNPPISGDEVDYPYNIQLITNSEIPFFEVTEDRAKAKELALSLNDYHFKISNDTGNTIEKGKSLKIDWANSTDFKEKVILANSTDFDYVAFTDIPDGESGFAVPKGKTVLALTELGIYSKGQRVSINSAGNFDDSGTVFVGTVLESRNLTSNGILKIKLD